MRILKAAAALAAMIAATAVVVPVVAQPDERAREWRDRAPGDDWLDREDRLWERGDRNDIDCPLTQVRREITNPLPEGWWNTPMINSLTGTEVQVIGGRRTLVCKYGPAGQIMRLEPRRRDCTPTRRGFDCRRARPGFPGGPGGWPPGPGRGVFSEGRVELRQTFSVDLDQGRVGGGGADLWFRAVNPMELYLEPVGGARIAWMGGGGGRRDCATADLRNDRITLGRINIGTTICYRTDQGRLGELTVTGFSNAGPSRIIEFDYRTWSGSR